MKAAAALFIVAAAFAWLTAHGLLQLTTSRTTPPAIVLHRQVGAAAPADERRERRNAVPRIVEQARLQAFSEGQDHRGTRP